MVLVVLVDLNVFMAQQKTHDGLVTSAARDKERRVPSIICHIHVKRWMMQEVPDFFLKIQFTCPNQRGLSITVQGVNVDIFKIQNPALVIHDNVKSENHFGNLIQTSSLYDM